MFSEKELLSIYLHKLGMMLDKAADMKLAKELGIGFSQFKILMAIEKNPGLPQNKIAQFLGQTEAAVSRQISLLHADGLLDREPKATNRREHVLSITDEGYVLLAKVWRVFDNLHEAFYADLSPADRAIMVSGCSKVLQRVQDFVCSANPSANDSKIK